MKKNLIIRFGKIGDVVSIIKFAEISNSDIINSINKYNFFLNKKVASFIFDNLKFDCKIINGNFFTFLKISNDYEKIYFYPQSNNITSIIIKYFLNIFLFILYRKKINIYYPGSQYFYQINNISNVKNILKNSVINNVVICYESHESANNLSVSTINNISRFLLSKFSNINIIVCGTNYIELDNNITNMIGKTNLDELVNYINSSDLVICCDSGPMHISTFLNKTTIAFISARQNMINWLPFSPSNYYIYDDLIECSNCNLNKCKRFLNLCVNSDINLIKFYDLFS